MAVGMVSSAQTLNPNTVIRSGESVATSLKALSDPNAKTYYHLASGARFIMPDGLEVSFLGGQFSTTDKQIIAELDKVVDKAASMIFSSRGSIETASNTAAKLAD